MAKEFKIQIPTQVVRSKKFTASEFVLLAKILQAYYKQPGKEKPLTFSIDHKAFMYYLFFKDNETFKKNLIGLFVKGVIESELYDKENQKIKLPRKGGLQLTINKLIIPAFNKERGYFTQIPYYVLNREIIEAVGYVGVRLMYYYKSYINEREPLKQFCFVAETTTAEDLNITEKTVIKYNKFLKVKKFIKIEKHKLENSETYDENGKLLFEKYNNHYFLRLENVSKYCSQYRENLSQIN